MNLSIPRTSKILLCEKEIILIVLASHPIQYFAPVYRALAEQEGIRFIAWFRTRVGIDEYYDPGFDETFKWDIPLTSGYDHSYLSKKVDLRGVEWSIIPALMKQRPNVLMLHGYNYLTNVIALLVAKLLGVKILLRGDTRLSPHHRKLSLKAAFKRFLFHFFNGFVSIGTLNQRYYEALGVPEHKIFFSPLSIRNELFDLGLSRKQVRETVRQKLNISNNSQVVLFVGKLLPHKRPMDLVEAMAHLKERHPNVVLLFVGSGSEQADLEITAKELGIEHRFLGFKNQTQLPEIYTASDVFVLPSGGEPWGLVVNEAMAAGLPVVVTNDVGAVDLVEGKDTGFVYPVGDVPALADILNELLLSPETRLRMGQNAKDIIANYDVEKSVEGIVFAVRSIMNQDV